MYIAVDEDNKRIYIENAQVKHSYYCPVCKSPLIIKNQGKIREHHFAHASGYNCTDNWHYDMSDWHRGWQAVFPEDNREIVIQEGSQTHRADIIVSSTVVEFQHSQISKEELNARNSFYHSLGYKVIWLFDFTDPKETEKEEPGPCKKNNKKWTWEHAKKIFNNEDIKLGKVEVFFQITRLEECPIMPINKFLNDYEAFISRGTLSVIS